MEKLLISRMDFIWFLKSKLKNTKIWELTNGTLVADPGGHILFMHFDSQVQIRFVDYNENFFIESKNQLRDLLIEITKPNNEQNIYEKLKQKKEAT